MPTVTYVPRARGGTHDRTTYPIVQYARAIKKNTAEFTAKDLKNFLRWLWKTEPYKNKLWRPTSGRRGYFT